MFLPDKICSLIADENYKIDNIGMSEASVLMYKNKILKVQEYNEEAENEYRMLQYLQGKLPVPSIYTHEISYGKSYLLMSKCAGEMACSHEYMNNPNILCKLLANGLKRLWSIDVSDCPSDQGLSCKLAKAAYNIENGLVDLNNVEPDTFSERGFHNPTELLQWLYENRYVTEACRIILTVNTNNIKIIHIRIMMNYFCFVNWISNQIGRRYDIIYYWTNCFKT